MTSNNPNESQGIQTGIASQERSWLYYRGDIYITYVSTIVPSFHIVISASSSLIQADEAYQGTIGVSTVYKDDVCIMLLAYYFISVEMVTESSQKCLQK